MTKRIKIYDYSVVLKDMVDIHYPSIEMVCSSKISCISWSSFHKGMLASSDYEGTVIVWDSATAQKTTVFQVQKLFLAHNVWPGECIEVEVKNISDNLI